jgi:hypothetical protein
MWSALCLGGALALGQPPAPPVSPQPALPNPAPIDARPASPGSGLGGFVPTVRADPPAAAPDSPTGDSNTGNGNNGSDEKTQKDNPNEYLPCLRPKCAEGGRFYHRLYRAYYKEFFPGSGASGNGDDTPPPYRRALPAPIVSPFPSAEWQGFPLIGVPPGTTVYPLMDAIYGGPNGQAWKDSRVKVYGWANASGNWSTAKQSNTPTSYWVKPNSMVLDQAVLRFERETDSAQTDHWDWGFRVTGDYGIDYRYFTAGGWFSRQLLVNNNLYGWDPTEVWGEIYIPGVAQGMKLTVGRWIATPDIETQFAPDNYTATHSLLFTVDVYTETGVMATVMLDRQWTVQAAIHAGADMAPWYVGAVPTGMFGVRWVSEDNTDSVYTVLNAINNAQYQYFLQDGQPAGHHNYNIFQSTWQHKVNDWVLTKTEAYIMWEKNAAVGGTPSLGPVQFGSGGGLGPTVPGTSLTYGVLNYTMFKLSKSAFFTVRNEWMKDEHGTRYGFPGNYTSNSIGLTYNFNKVLQVRPEIGYYRNWNNPAFDNGARTDLWLYGFDVTYRF